MADRDLINKPMALPLPEEQDSERKHLKPAPMGKLGVRERAREVARETSVDTEPQPGRAGPKAPKPAAPGAGVQRAGTGQGSQKASEAATEAGLAKGPAFQAAYFNKDVEATSQANPRARPMAALRGEEGATDLRRVVLPGPQEDEVPAPEELGQTLALMGAEAAEGTSTPGMTTLLRRQGAWAQERGMTPEKLKARMAELEEKVAVRKAALTRMSLLSSKHLARAASVAQAFLRQGVEDASDLSLEDDGNALIEGVGRQAEGLHKRLRKMMRSRR